VNAGVNLLTTTIATDRTNLDDSLASILANSITATNVAQPAVQNVVSTSTTTSTAATTNAAASAVVVQDSLDALKAQVAACTARESDLSSRLSISESARQRLITVNLTAANALKVSVFDLESRNAELVR
jgi:hypothetical protein